MWKEEGVVKTMYLAEVTERKEFLTDLGTVKYGIVYGWETQQDCFK